MKMESMEKKQYDQHDKLLFLSLVESHKNVIENKKTDATSIQIKKEIWENITDMYNASSSVERTPKQLKKLWDNLKQKTRRADSEQNEMLRSEGGHTLDEDIALIYEKVRAIISSVDCEISNTHDNLVLTDFEEPSRKRFKPNKVNRRIETEASLRITKMEQSIRQQTELHELKLEIAQAELKAAQYQEEYWRLKVESLL